MNRKERIESALFMTFLVGGLLFFPMMWAVAAVAFDSVPVGASYTLAGAFAIFTFFYLLVTWRNRKVKGHGSIHVRPNIDSRIVGNGISRVANLETARRKRAGARQG